MFKRYFERSLKAYGKMQTTRTLCHLLRFGIALSSNKNFFHINWRDLQAHNSDANVKKSFIYTTHSACVNC